MLNTFFFFITEYWTWALYMLGKNLTTQLHQNSDFVICFFVCFFVLLELSPHQAAHAGLEFPIFLSQLSE